MPDKFIFADEAGCFTFEKKPNVSKYFILCTVALDSCEVGTDLLALRRRLAWEGAELGDCFHACEDKQAVRNAVYETIGRHSFTVQATIMEKTKALPRVRATQATFYKYGWYYHFKHGTSGLIGQAETLITAASIGTRKERNSFRSAVDDVMRQTVRAKKWATDFWPAGADPCLQVADYCAWAIQRKWERGDLKSYDLIKDRVTYEYDLWQRGEIHHY